MWKKQEEKVLQILNSNPSQIELRKLLKVHKEKIRNLQHERLIHLIVTMTVALTLTILICTTILSQQVALLFVDAALSALLVGYLFHYRMLENTTQRWYSLTEKIRSETKPRH